MIYCILSHKNNIQIFRNVIFEGFTASFFFIFDISLKLLITNVLKMLCPYTKYYATGTADFLFRNFNQKPPSADITNVFLSSTIGFLVLMSGSRSQCHNR